VLNAIAKGNVFHQVQRTLDFVHGLLPPQTLRIANRERRAAFPGEMEIASRGRMDGLKREIVSREPPGQFVRVLGRAVIEMPARAKKLDGGYSRARRFGQQGGRQFPVYEKVRGKNTLRRHDVRALFVFIEFASTLSDAPRSVKERNGGV
jgi:hypothetical protein